MPDTPTRPPKNRSDWTDDQWADWFEHEFDPDSARHEDVTDLAAIAAAADVVKAAEHGLMLVVLAARFHGRTWAEIGGRLGVTRQAAHARFGHLDTVNQLTKSPDGDDAGQPAASHRSSSKTAARSSKSPATS